MCVEEGQDLLRREKPYYLYRIQVCADDNVTVIKGHCYYFFSDANGRGQDDSTLIGSRSCHPVVARYMSLMMHNIKPMPLLEHLLSHELLVPNLSHVLHIAGP